MTRLKPAAFNSALQPTLEAHHRAVSGPWKFTRTCWQRLPDWFRAWFARLLGTLLVLLAPFLAYGLTAFILGSILTHPPRPAPRSGVEVFVITFGVHTDLMVPRRNPVMDWSPWFPPEHFAKPRLAEYVTLGWGDRQFFEEVREWDDLTATAALRSTLLPSPTLMHVSHFPRPLETNQVQRVVLPEENYARLCRHLRAGFQLNRHNRPQLVPKLTYQGTDAFYEGAGSYDGILTCNEWAARALRSAGVSMGLWTPFAGQIRECLGSTVRSALD